MIVTLIDFTGACAPDRASYAAAMLILAKSTRLTMSPGLFNEILSWPEEKKMEELAYIARSIPASWEFLDYTFLIEGVTRAFTHQFVRGRHASYAQQTMRVLDVSDGPGWDYLTGPSIRGDLTLESAYESTMDTIADEYKFLIEHGAAIEDARGILPTNILTNIMVKMNFRTLVETVRKRSSSRVQGEYRAVLTTMREAVLAVHPWAHHFLARGADTAADALDNAIQSLPVDQAEKTRMIKLLDELRTA